MIASKVDLLALAHAFTDQRSEPKRMISGSRVLIFLVNSCDDALRTLSGGLTQGGASLVATLRRGLDDLADYAEALVTSYAGPLDAEAVARYIEAAIAPRQTALHDQVGRTQKTILQQEWSRAQRRLASAWDRLDLQVDHVLELQTRSATTELVTTASNPVAEVGVSPVAATDAISGFWNILAFGVFAILSMPFAFSFAAFESMRRDRFIGRVRFEIDRRYRNGISENIRQFERRWSEATERTLEVLTRECNRRLATLMTQMESLQEDHRRQSGRVSDRRRELDDMQEQLEFARRQLAGFAPSEPIS